MRRTKSFDCAVLALWLQLHPTPTAKKVANYLNFYDNEEQEPTLPDGVRITEENVRNVLRAYHVDPGDRDDTTDPAQQYAVVRQPDKNKVCVPGFVFRPNKKRRRWD